MPSSTLPLDPSDLPQTTAPSSTSAHQFHASPGETPMTTHPKRALTLAVLAESTRIHVYTDGSATDAVANGGGGIFIRFPEGNKKADQLAKLGARGPQTSNNVSFREKLTLVKAAVRPQSTRDDYHLLDRWEHVVLMRLRIIDCWCLHQHAPVMCVIKLVMRNMNVARTVDTRLKYPVQLIVLVLLTVCLSHTQDIFKGKTKPGNGSTQIHPGGQPKLESVLETQIKPTVSFASTLDQTMPTVATDKQSSGTRNPGSVTAVWNTNSSPESKNSLAIKLDNSVDEHSSKLLEMSAATESEAQFFGGESLAALWNVSGSERSRVFLQVSDRNETTDKERTIRRSSHQTPSSMTPANFRAVVPRYSGNEATDKESIIAQTSKIPIPVSARALLAIFHGNKTTDTESMTRQSTHQTSSSVISTSSLAYLGVSGGKEATDTESIIQQSRHQTPVTKVPVQDPTTHLLQCFPPVRITDFKGRIEWTRSSWSCESATWHILAPSDHAVTLRINEISLVEGCELEVHSLKSGQPTDDFSETTLVRSFFVAEIYSPDFGLHPVMSYTNHMVMHAFFSHACHQMTVDVDYTSHPLDDMPTGQTTVLDLTDSWVKYNCTPNIPEHLMCDMTKQCVDGADERNCSYHEDGSCGDWIPYGRYCLKGFFLGPGSHAYWLPAPTNPDEAEKACKKNHGATLAKLTDKEGMTLAEDMIKSSGFISAVIGLKKVQPVSAKLRHLYRYIWQWGDEGSPIAHDQIDIQRDGPLDGCTVLSVYPTTLLRPVRCVLPESTPYGYVCMREKPSLPKQQPSGLLRLDFPTPNVQIDRFPTKQCPDGSVVQLFHRCLWEDIDTKSSTSHVGWSPSNLPLFHCQFGESIHYTLVCDGNSDCLDGSDEGICLRPRLSPTVQSSFMCNERSQLIPSSQHCDGMPDCFDGTDEESCTTCAPQLVLCSGVGCFPMSYIHYFDACPEFPWAFFPDESFLPGRLVLDGMGMSQLEELQNCPDTHFSCSNGLCIPSYLINNGEQDCLLGEDENVAKENVTCPGYYRCQDVGLCVHKDHVCDGIYHCPNKDDERYCDLSCPDNCTCEGYAYTCREMFDPARHLHVRYLDLSGTFLPLLDNISTIEYLYFLNLSFCQLQYVSLQNMLMLNVLDLSFNTFSTLHSMDLEQLPGLSMLNLSGNPLGSVFDSSFSSFLLTANTAKLQQLIVRKMNTTYFADRPFWPLSELKVLDLRDNKIDSFHKDALAGLKELRVLYTDNHKLCCPVFAPSLDDCYAPTDELSSCADLLRFDVFRAFLWGFAALAVTGNFGSLIYRLCSQTQRRSQQTSRVLVANLCASDLLMGVYMMVIGSADLLFRGVYVSYESEWKESGVCTMAGFLGFVSSEVSAFVICLVTLDRFLVLCFPLSSNIHMNVTTASLACGLAWIVGLVLAAVPLMAQWEFYEQNGICLPLPVTRQQYQGQQYAFGVFIVLNFIMFLLIGVGQLLIYHSVRITGSALSAERRQQEMTIARRLFLIVFTDFLCWFPVGLLGLLASQEIPISGEVNVWIAIFVLPLNSALNPFLYTLNGLAEQWRRQREARRVKKMLGKLHSEIPKWTPAAVEEMTRICLRSKLVKRERVLQLLGVENSAATMDETLDNVTSRMTPVSESEFKGTTRYTELRD